jgi:hypothetical protein
VGRFGRSALDPNRSPGSAYGKNTREELISDVEFMLNYARDKFKTENLFLYGHSMASDMNFVRAVLMTMRDRVDACPSSTPVLERTH